MEQHTKSKNQSQNQDCPSDDMIYKLLKGNKEDVLLALIFIGMKYNYEDANRILSSINHRVPYLIHPSYPLVCFKDKIMAHIGNHVRAYSTIDANWEDPGDEDYIIKYI